MEIQRLNTAATQQIGQTTATQTAVQTEEALFTNEATETQNVTPDYIATELGMLESIGEKLGLDLTGELETDFDALNEYPAKLDEMIRKIEKLIEEKLQELKDLEAEQAGLKTDEANLTTKINQLTNQQKQNTQEQNELAQKIEDTQISNQNARAQYQLDYDTKLAEVEAAYNPKKDGDKQEYINKQMSGFEAPGAANISSLQSELSSLQSDGNNVNLQINVSNTALTSVRNKLQTIDVSITVIKTEIEVANQDKASVESERATIPAKAKEAVKNAVGPKEWEIIENNKIDLSATLDDGSPRYMLAKGQTDDKYHLYDLGGKDPSGRIPSVVRLNAPKGGFNIISRGNGYIKSYRQTGESDPGSRKTFQFTISDTSFKSEKESAKYRTESPLAFDLDGGGFTTSNETIKYDIDGDGKLDNINNVLEGVLAFDADHDGIAGEDGNELFGNNTDLNNDGKADGFKNGFDALKALAFSEKLFDGTNDLVLDEKDLSILSEKYGLSMKMGYNGESYSLDSLGISQINLAATNETHLEENFDGKSNQLMTQEGATFVQNGQEKDYADIWHKKK